MVDLRKSLTLHTILGVVFFLSGLVVSLLQAVIYVLFYKTNRRLYRRLNYYLMYTLCSKFVSMAEWYSGFSCKLYGSEETLQMFGKEHSIIVMNHTYEVDWLVTWCLCEKFGKLGNTKSFAKASLKYVPVLGWSWVFGESIFLERNWEKDKQTLGERLDQLMEYDDPIALFLFAEGTRFTKDKHEVSLKFAKDRGLHQLKHHLLPRAKGFNFTVSHLKSKVNAIYDAQLAFPNNDRPTVYGMLNGKKFQADIFLRRIPMSQIPTDSDAETTKFLYELYKEKDELMENYLKTSNFPGKFVEIKWAIKPLLNVLFWLIVVGFPFLSLLYKLLFWGNTWVTATTLVGMVSAYFGMQKMISTTKSDKGSSYGKTYSSPKIKDVPTEKNSVDSKD